MNRSTVPVDQPGHQVRRDPQACGVRQLQTVAKTLEVSPVPFVNRVVKPPVIMQINQVTKHDAVSQIRHTIKERQEQMAAVPANGVRRPNMKQCARLKPRPGFGHRC